MTREDRILQILEGIREDMTEMKLVTVKQEENLKEHMRRSLANEKAVELIKTELKQVSTHVLLVQHAGKAIGWIASSSIVLYALKRLLG